MVETTIELNPWFKERLSHLLFQLLKPKMMSRTWKRLKIRTGTFTIQDIKTSTFTIWKSNIRQNLKKKNSKRKLKNKETEKWNGADNHWCLMASNTGVTAEFILLMTTRRLEVSTIMLNRELSHHNVPQTKMTRMLRRWRKPRTVLMTLLIQKVSMTNTTLTMLMQLLLPLQLRYKLEKPAGG